MQRLLLSLFVALVGCAGSPHAEPSKTTPVAQVPETPGAKCLVTAEAKRDRKPNEPEKVGVKHILVKAKGPRHGLGGALRVREEACLRAIEVRDKLRAGADFAEMVQAYSDEPGAASRGGSIGTVQRSEVLPPFADAAFELTIGELSDVVETEFGFHVIIRTE